MSSVSSSSVLNSVALCGARSLPDNAIPLVSSVVGALLSAGRSLSIGCATGADAVAVSAVVSRHACSQLSVFAIGGQCGSGFVGRASSFSGVRVASVLGASVSWWSGGAASLSARQRLVARSLVCVGSANAVVAFVTSMPSHSWSGGGVWRSCGSGSTERRGSNLDKVHVNHIRD